MIQAHEELAKAIYDGTHLDEVKEYLAQAQKQDMLDRLLDHIFDISALIGRFDVVSKINLVHLIVLAEKNHPGHFKEYKALLDQMTSEEKGAQKVQETWKNEEGYRQEDWTAGLGQTGGPIQVKPSSAMQAYLNRLAVLNEPARKMALAIIRANKETHQTNLEILTDPTQKAQEQADFKLAQGNVVHVYRQNCPHSKQYSKQYNEIIQQFKTLKKNQKEGI